jgi:hypothetical protein
VPGVRPALSADRPSGQQLARRARKSLLLPIEREMFDFFWIGLGSLRPIGRGRGTNAEELIWILASLIFPALDLVFSLVALSQTNSDVLSVVTLGLPITFTVLTIYLCRKARADLGWAIQSVLVCFLFCLGASFVASILSMF